MLAADSSRARLDMMLVELGCFSQVVDVSRSSALRVDSGGTGGATSGVDPGGAGGATSGVDLVGAIGDASGVDLDGVVTANHLSGGTASGVGSGGDGVSRFSTM